jgi:hypothetical protein
MISLLKLDFNIIKGEKKRSVGRTRRRRRRSVGSILNVHLCYEFLCYSKNILED